MPLPGHVIVKQSNRARRLALRLDPKDRAFHLVVPRGVSMKKAQIFVENHEIWMREQLRALPERMPFEDGACIPVLGRGRIIDVYRDEALKRTNIRLTQTHLEVRTPEEDPQSRIVRFLKSTAKEALSELSHEKAARIGKKLHAVRIGDTKSRWGSCSAQGTLAYSWRLILAPPEAMDYVVAHEVAHLTHLDHSKAFWSLCRKLSENFLEGRTWMQNHGRELMRFG